MKNLIFAFIGLLFCSMIKSASSNAFTLTPPGTNTLEAREKLLPGQFLKSNNGVYHLRYQHDGNLVLYKNGNQPLWSARTHQTQPGEVVMQYIGNLEIRNSNGKVIWSTNTAGVSNRGSRLVLQDDGNLVIYNRANKATWNTGTNTPPPSANKDVLFPGEFLLPGQKLESKNGKYRAVYNHAGNFVLFKDGHIQLWSSQTYTRPGKVVMQQTDGNLVVYRPNNSPVWSSQTNKPANRDSRLVMQDDGNLVIYKPNNEPIWATHTAGGVAAKKK